MVSLKAQAPSTRIRIFLNPQRFRSGFKNFPVHLKSWSLEIDYSRAPCLGADQKAGGLWERDCDSGVKFARCAAILVYCSVRDWTLFCCVIEFEKIRIHPFTRYRIRCRFIFYHYGGRILKEASIVITFQHSTLVLNFWVSYNYNYNYCKEFILRCFHDE